MSSKEIKVKVTDATPDKMIGNQWRNGSTLVTLTPGDTDSKGVWSTEPLGSVIDSSGGTKEHARYDWNRLKNTLDLIVDGFTDGASKKIPPLTVLTLNGFKNMVGESGGGLFFWRRTSVAVAWEIVGLKTPDEEEEQADGEEQPDEKDGVLSNKRFGEIVRWGKSQSADGVAATVARTANLTRSDVKEMIQKGLNRKSVEAFIEVYKKALANPRKAKANLQLEPRLKLMRKILELWPE